MERDKAGGKRGGEGVWRQWRRKDEGSSIYYSYMTLQQLAEGPTVDTTVNSRVQRPNRHLPGLKTKL